MKTLVVALALLFSSSVAAQQQDFSKGLTANIAALIEKIPAGAKLIPGHGPLSTIDDLKSYHRMLVETTGIVRQKIAAAKTLAQIKSEGLPAEWKSWGNGFIKTDMWLELVYLSLTKK